MKFDLKNPHHAYLLVGERLRTRDILADLLNKDLRIQIKANPDIREHETDVFTIDEARNLKSSHYMKPISGRSIFIVSFNSITFEAQQSLLKVFEDPVHGVHFFIIAPTLHNFLPTLLSRFYVVEMDRIENESGDDGSREESTEKKSSKKMAVDFISLSPGRRMAITAKFIEEKDKGGAIEFLNEMETIYGGLFKKGDSTLTKALRDIMDMRGFLRSRAPSLKTILDHLAVTLPVMPVTKKI